MESYPQVSTQSKFERNLNREESAVQADILQYPFDLFKTQEYRYGIRFDIYDASGDAVTEQRTVKKLFDSFTQKVSSAANAPKESLLAEADKAGIKAETGVVLKAVDSSAGSIEGAVSAGIDAIGGLLQTERKWKSGDRDSQVEAIVGVKSPQNKVASIYLYLPGNLSFASQFDYEDADMSAMDIARGVQGALGIGNPEAQADIMRKAVMAGVSKASVPGFDEAAIMNAMRLQSRQIQNPFLVQMFKGVQRRSFTFDFEMVPRSEEEARNVYAIVNTFRRYAHPSRNTSGRFLDFPAEFDLTFIYKPNEDERAIAIPKIKKCAIKSVKVDYGENVFAAHGGAVAMPTKVKMSLEMSELALLARQEIEDGY